MKHFIKKSIYVTAMALATAACSDDFTYPPMILPEASMQPNTTIADLKELYWQDGRNYCSTILPIDDADMIIKGRVVSSDSTGNIFKNIIIEDGTAALTVAINAYDLYQSYQYGQEIVVNVTGLQIGGYNGLMQLGSESSYNGQPSMTFMDKDLFDSHAEPNGLSDPAKVTAQLFTIPELTAIKGDSKQLCLTQSKLVKVNDVRFVDAGQAFAPTSTTDRYVEDKDGNRLNVRCSSYSTFKNDIIPAGYGSVTAILSYYGTDWQLMLIDLDGLDGFTPATPGTPDKPDTPDIPDTPSDETVIYTGLESSDTGWNIDDATLPSALTYIWKWDEQYKYMKASAYKGENFAADSYLTTQLDLSDYKTASAGFDHAYKFGNDVANTLTFIVREQGAKEWTKLNIPNWPSGNDWTFVGSGAVRLDAFAGKKIEIGFRYTSTASAAATWEVKNFKVSAAK